LRDLEQVVYFNAYVVTNAGNSQDLHKNQLLAEDEYEKLLEDPNMQFDVGIGAEAVKQLLHDLAQVQSMSVQTTKMIAVVFWNCLVSKKSHWLCVKN
jgi:DNA-directed RNA polymerase subunit beta'